MRAAIVALLVFSVSHSGISGPVDADDGPLSGWRVVQPKDVLNEMSGGYNERDVTSQEKDSAETGGSYEFNSQEVNMDPVLGNFLLEEDQSPQEEQVAPVEQVPEESVDRVSSEDDFTPTDPPAESDQQNTDSTWQRLLAQAKIIHFLQMVRAMAAQRNQVEEAPTVAMLPGVLPVELDDQSQSEEEVLRPGDNMAMPFAGDIGPMNPLDAMNTQVQEQMLDDESMSTTEDESGTGAMAIVFVPVWKVIEKTVYLVIRQPSDENPENETELTYGAADVFTLLLLGLCCIVIATSFIVILHRAIRQRRERALFTQVKAANIARPVYVQPAQHLPVLTTKVDGSNIISEKPPLDPNKV